MSDRKYTSHISPLHSRRSLLQRGQSRHSLSQSQHGQSQHSLAQYGHWGSEPAVAQEHYSHSQHSRPVSEKIFLPQNINQGDSSELIFLDRDIRINDHYDGQHSGQHNSHIPGIRMNWRQRKNAVSNKILRPELRMEKTGHTRERNQIPQSSSRINVAGVTCISPLEDFHKPLLHLSSNRNGSTDNEAGHHGNGTITTSPVNMQKYMGDEGLTETKEKRNQLLHEINRNINELSKLGISLTCLGIDEVNGTKIMLGCGKSEKFFRKHPDVMQRLSQYCKQ